MFDASLIQTVVTVHVKLTCSISAMRRCSGSKESWKLRKKKASAKLIAKTDQEDRTMEENEGATEEALLGELILLLQDSHDPGGGKTAASNRGGGEKASAEHYCTFGKVASPAETLCVLQ